MKKFLVLKAFAPDQDSAGKVIVKTLGSKKETLEFFEFYKLFAKSMFRVALIDMI